MGAAAFLGKLRMVLCQQQQELSMGWHRRENPKGAAAVQTGIEKSNEPGQLVPMPQKSQLSTQKGHSWRDRLRQGVSAGGQGQD